MFEFKKDWPIYAVVLTFMIVVIFAAKNEMKDSEQCTSRNGTSIISRSGQQICIRNDNIIK